MHYHQDSHYGIHIEFEGLEVETVREAYKERIAYLVSIGNENSVSEYQKWIAAWKGKGQNYKGAGNEPLVEVLQYFCDTTEERVDEILGIGGNSSRYKMAGRRYELGQNASHLLIGIEVQSTIDREWEELID